MTPDDARKVLDALRSGRYQQGTGGYRTATGPALTFTDLDPMCAVGVAADALGFRWGRAWTTGGGTVTPSDVHSFLTARGIDRGLRLEIVDLNDHHRWTLPQIADWLAALLTVEEPEPIDARILVDA